MARWIPASDQSYVYSVSLFAGCYRHIRISADDTLYDLHSAILEAFGFDDDHAHAFFMDNKLWSDKDDYYLDNMRENCRATRNFTLSQLALQPGHKFKYVFDFGDTWVFSLRLLRVLDETTELPRVIRQAGDPPGQYCWSDKDGQEENEDEEDASLMEFPQVYAPGKIKSLYKALPLPESTLNQLEKYFTAFANLYWIIPLHKALEIYNSQNPPIDEDAFLQFANILRHDHQPFLIMGEDEIYADCEEKTAPKNRMIIHQSLFIDDPEDFADCMSKQHDKPYYVPPREELIKYANEIYHEPMPALSALQDYLQKTLKLSPKKAADIAEEMRLLARMGNANVQDVCESAKHLGLTFHGTDDLNDFLRRYMDVSNNTRMPLNRGHTPNELMASEKNPLRSIKLMPGLKAAIKKGDINFLDMCNLAFNDVFPTPSMQTSFLDELSRIKQEMQDEAAGNHPPDPEVSVSRNAPCPCGSGRKYKHCCGKNKPLLN